MDWAHAVGISQSLGFAFAMLARFVPFIPTRIAPKVGIVTIFLTNIMMLWSKFVESAGIATTALMEPITEHGVYMAGFGSILGLILKPILIVAQPIALSAGQYWLNRLFHEGGIKAVIAKSGVPVV